jgi:nucleotide-binding universal stress UspA family protein
MEDRAIQLRRILVPTDFSAPSKQAIAYAFELAQTLGATLVLLHVIEELPPYVGFLPPEETIEALEELAGRARLDLAQVAAQTQGGKVEVTCRAVVGAPAPKIIEVDQ